MSRGTERYRRLKASVVEAGILAPARTFYAVLTAIVMAGYLLSGYAIAVSQSFVWLAVACLVFSFFTVQLAGIMHDCGHRAVFRSRHLNDILGFICSASIGMIFASWRYHHNQHHAFPNQQNKDPDYSIPGVALNPYQFASKPRIGRAIARYQALYFYLVVATASLSNRLGGVTYFLKHPDRRDFLSVAVYLPVTLLFFVGPFVFFPLEKALFVCLFVHFASGLYLANCFAPNHKGMAMVREHQRMSFIEQQIVTARNVRGGTVTDILLVGLNHQIEHHLFPNCPRLKLRRIRPYVEAFCAAEGIPYTEAGLVEGSRAILTSLMAITRTGNPAPVQD